VHHQAVACPGAQGLQCVIKTRFSPAHKIGKIAMEKEKKNFKNCLTPQFSNSQSL